MLQNKLDLFPDISRLFRTVGVSTIPGGVKSGHLTPGQLNLKNPGFLLVTLKIHASNLLAIKTGSKTRSLVVVPSETETKSEEMWKAFGSTSICFRWEE